MQWNSSRSLRKLAVVLLLAVVYLIAGKLGLRLALVNPSATAVWAPTGIALASLLILGYQVWPGIFLGAFLVNITTAGSLATSTGIAAGNTLEALAGCYLMNRFARGSKAFTRAQDIFRFAVLAGLVSTAISATFGVSSLCLGGLAKWSEYRAIWSTWWLGDAGGALVITPLLVLWLRNPHLRWNRTQLAEAIILLASIFVIGQNVFGGFFSSSTRNYPLEFLCIPFLIWAAFRFSPRETATAVFVIAVIAISGTLAGFGPFVRADKNESLVLLQVYVSVSAVIGLALAALVSERKEFEEKLQHLAATDPVTGLANYRRFMEVLTEEINRSQRTGSPFAVLLLDLDGMKRINDRHGHLVGNRALSRLSEVLQSCGRNIDTVARFGGDEFAMLLLETDGTAARQVAGRVLVRLAADQEEPRLTVGIGISGYPSDGDTVESLLEAADRALYQMKRNGGGAVPEESLS
jgi:diguanylate cyclase (GGDEF)-like protein